MTVVEWDIDPENKAVSYQISFPRYLSSTIKTIHDDDLKGSMMGSTLIPFLG